MNGRYTEAKNVDSLPKPFLPSRGVAGEARADRNIERDVNAPHIAWLVLLCAVALTVALSTVVYVVAGVPLPW